MAQIWPGHAGGSGLVGDRSWSGTSQWQAQVQVAKPFGAETPLASRQTNARNRLWLMKGF
jgi:hypothetical protein